MENNCYYCGADIDKCVCDFGVAFRLRQAALKADKNNLGKVIVNLENMILKERAEVGGLKVENKKLKEELEACRKFLSPIFETECEDWEPEEDKDALLLP